MGVLVAIWFAWLETSLIAIELVSAIAGTALAAAHRRLETGV